MICMTEHTRNITIDYLNLCPYLKAQNNTEEPITLTSEPDSEGGGKLQNWR